MGIPFTFDCVAPADHAIRTHGGVAVQPAERGAEAWVLGGEVAAVEREQTVAGRAAVGVVALAARRVATGDAGFVAHGSGGVRKVGLQRKSHRMTESSPLSPGRGIG